MTSANDCPPSSKIKSLGDIVDKENVAPLSAARCYRNRDPSPKKRSQPLTAKVPPPNSGVEKPKQPRHLTPPSLQICKPKGEQEGHIVKLESGEEHVPYSSDVWYFSDNEAAPASSWSTLPNRLGQLSSS